LDDALRMAAELAATSVPYRRSIAQRIQPCCKRGNRCLRPFRQARSSSAREARLDANISGRPHGIGAGLYLGHREWKEGALPTFPRNSCNWTGFLSLNCYAVC